MNQNKIQMRKQKSCNSFPTLQEICDELNPSVCLVNTSPEFLQESDTVHDETNCIYVAYIADGKYIINDFNSKLRERKVDYYFFYTSYSENIRKLIVVLAIEPNN